MSSGIFGPRTPSFPHSRTYPQSSNSSYNYSSFTPYGHYSSQMSYRYQPQSTYQRTLYPSAAYAQHPYPNQYTRVPHVYSNSPYQYSPAQPLDTQVLPYYSISYYSPVLPYSAENSAHGLDTILIAILVLVSLDLIFVRPLKRTAFVPAAEQ